jgi:hypothetical protein
MPARSTLSSLCMGCGERVRRVRPGFPSAIRGAAFVAWAYPPFRSYECRRRSSRKRRRSGRLLLVPGVVAGAAVHVALGFRPGGVIAGYLTSVAGGRGQPHAQSLQIQGHAISVGCGGGRLSTRWSRSICTSGKFANASWHIDVTCLSRADLARTDGRAPAAASRNGTSVGRVGGRPLLLGEPF